MWVRQRHLHIGAHLFTRLLSNWVLGQPQLPINCFCPLSSLKLWFSESQQERNLNGVQTHHFREAFLQLPPGKPWSKPSPQPSVQLAELWVTKAELNQSAQPNEEDHSLRDKIQKDRFSLMTQWPTTPSGRTDWKGSSIHADILNTTHILTDDVLGHSNLFLPGCAYDHL